VAVGSPFGTLVLIINPQAGRGQVGQEVPEIERQLQAKKLTYRLIETSTPGQATETAREALGAGDRFIVAVGGDETVHAVVNGMIVDDRPAADGSVLGIIPAGSGCDFVRTFGLPGDVIKAVRHLADDQTYPIDAGKVSYTDGDGKGVRYFANIAEAGFGGAVIRRASRLSDRMKKSGYFFGFWLSLLRQRPFEVEVKADRKSFSSKATNVLVANCQFSRGGMKVSPRSYPGDGLFDVQISTGPRSEAFTMIPKMYRGEHVPNPNIKELRGREITVEADRPLPVHADGEFLGTTPAAFTVLPQAITLKI
jgi:YegS/Rv2252/BmrU family lipid kinase